MPPAEPVLCINDGRHAVAARTFRPLPCLTRRGASPASTLTRGPSRPPHGYELASFRFLIIDKHMRLYATKRG